MMKKLALAAGLLLGAVGAAGAAGVFTSGYPQATLPLTGNETFGADTGLPQGLQPQSEGITLFATRTYERPGAALIYGTTITPDWNVSSFGTVTLAGNPTIPAINNPVPGGNYRMFLTQDTTGSRLVTWGTPFKWAGGTAPTLSTVAGKTDIVACFIYTATYYSCSAQIDVR